MVSSKSESLTQKGTAEVPGELEAGCHKAAGTNGMLQSSCGASGPRAAALLDAVRSEIDSVDAGLAHLYEKRLHLSLEARRIKEEAGLPAVDGAREAAIISAGLAGISDPSVRKFYPGFAVRLLSDSKAYQAEKLDEQNLPATDPAQ